MTKLQKLGYGSLASLLTFVQANAALDFGTQKASGLSGGQGDGEAIIIKVITNLMTFVTLIAVIYCLWAGFQIMTAGGDDDKVKHGKSTIIQVGLGIVVMWLAYGIVTWVIKAITQ